MASERKQQILEAFVRMLEANPSGRITTAALAREVGVTEAALYRHFPSKARMFESLIEFVEDSVFSRLGRIQDSTDDPVERLRALLQLVLAFAEKNPGITRLLTGDALAGETERLSRRVHQFFERLETEVRQILRDGELRHGLTCPSQPACATSLMAEIEGRLRQFVRSGFQRRPTEQFDAAWSMLERGFFDRTQPVVPALRSGVAAPGRP